MNYIPPLPGALLLISITAIGVTVAAYYKCDNYEEKMLGSGDAKLEKTPLKKAIEQIETKNVNIMITSHDIRKFYEYVIINKESKLNKKMKLTKFIMKASLIISVTAFITGCYIEDGLDNLNNIIIPFDEIEYEI